MQAGGVARGSANGGMSLIWRIRPCASRVTGPQVGASGSSRTASVASALEARWAAIRAVRSQSDSVSPLRTRKGPSFRKGAACLMPPPVPWSVGSCENARHMRGQGHAQRMQVAVVLQVPPHVAQGPWDVLEIAIVALLPGDIDEPPGRLEVALDAGQVEESLERHPVERRTSLGPSFEVADDQFIDQVLVKRQIGVPQQGREIVGGWAHQGILEVEDPE